MSSLAVLVDARGGRQDAAARTVATVRQQRADAEVIVWHDDEDDAPQLEGREHLIWLEAGLELLPGTLAAIESVLGRFPDTRLLYADDWSARRPDPSPIRLRSQDYLGGLRVFSAVALLEAGGVSGAVPGAEAYDLSLKMVSSAAASVLHVPEVLYRPAPVAAPVRSAAIRSAIENNLRRLEIAATVEVDDSGAASIEYAIQGEPLVSIVIPTRGGAATIAGTQRVLVVEAIRSVLDRSTYRNLEFVVVADDPTPQAVVDELRDLAGDRLRLVRWSDAFSFSGKMNRGAAFATGEFLVLLNDDIEVATPGWIEAMLGLAQQAGVGLVGSLLYFEDGSIQHAGHLYRDGAAGHIAFKWPAEWQDPLRSIGVEREVAGVTAACAMIKADRYWSVGGFSSLFPSNYNDVDLCMKLRFRGFSIVVTPRSRLYHFESKTRVATVAPAETDALLRRWSSRMQRDPYWPDYLA